MTDAPQAAPQVHDRAVVAPGAELAPGVVIEANCVVERDVTVGPRSRIRSGTVLLAGSRVGADCRIGPQAVIGGEPMDRDFAGEPSVARVGDGAEIREFSTVHRATGEGAETVVGPGALVMCYVHVSHNGYVGREAVVTNMSQLGGHAQVGDYAVLGAAAMVHQHVRIGDYAMLGSTAAANRDILPYTLSQGRPAKNLRLNRVALRRRGFARERYRALERALRACRDNDRDALAAIAEGDGPAAADARHLIEFIDGSRRGIGGFGDLEHG